MDRCCGDATVGCADGAARGRAATPCRTFRSYSAPAELRRAGDGSSALFGADDDDEYPRAAEDDWYVCAGSAEERSECVGSTEERSECVGSTEERSECPGSAAPAGSVDAAQPAAPEDCRTHVACAAAEDNYECAASAGAEYNHSFAGGAAWTGCWNAGYQCAGGSGAEYSRRTSASAAGCSYASTAAAYDGSTCAGGWWSAEARAACERTSSPPSPPATPPDSRPPSPPPSPGLRRGEGCVVWWSPRRRYARMVTIGVSRLSRRDRNTPHRQLKHAKLSVHPAKETEKVRKVVSWHTPYVTVLPQQSWVGGEPWTTPQGLAITVPALYVPVRAYQSIPDAAWLESCAAVSPFLLRFVFV
eukprot:TRINITY_DN85_c0_g1_i2.p1 TRINITY_DN85_c0_g1~~TRINITY_DN85_c0_g1_i2.p1  ORF type:complete len:360 (+),score=102.35 TRINITY_DN85_c0_g1_i2:68-1147(+)